MNKEKNKVPSTYERLIQEDAEFEKDLEKRYHKFILSEILLSETLLKTNCFSPKI